MSNINGQVILNGGNVTGYIVTPQTRIYVDENLTNSYTRSGPGTSLTGDRAVLATNGIAVQTAAATNQSGGPDNTDPSGTITLTNSTIYLTEDIDTDSKGTGIVRVTNSELIYSPSVTTRVNPIVIRARNGNAVTFDLTDTNLSTASTSGNDTAPGFNIAGVAPANSALVRTSFNNWWVNTVVDIPLIGVNFGQTGLRTRGSTYFVRMGRPTVQSAMNTAVTSWFAGCTMPATLGTNGLNFFNTNLALSVETRVNVFIVDPVLRSDGNLPINYFTNDNTAPAPQVRLCQGWRPTFQDGVGVTVADVRLKFDDVNNTLFEAVNGITAMRPLLASDRPATENSNQLVHPAGYYFQHATALASGTNNVTNDVTTPSTNLRFLTQDQINAVNIIISSYTHDIAGTAANRYTINPVQNVVDTQNGGAITTTDNITMEVDAQVQGFTQAQADGRTANLVNFNQAYRRFKADIVGVTNRIDLSNVWTKAGTNIDFGALPVTFNQAAGDTQATIAVNTVSGLSIRTAGIISQSTEQGGVGLLSSFSNTGRVSLSTVRLNGISINHTGSDGIQAIASLSSPADFQTVTQATREGQITYNNCTTTQIDFTLASGNAYIVVNNYTGTIRNDTAGTTLTVIGTTVPTPTTTGGTQTIAGVTLDTGGAGTVVFETIPRIVTQPNRLIVNFPSDLPTDGVITMYRGATGATDANRILTKTTLGLASEIVDGVRTIRFSEDTTTDTGFDPLPNIVGETFRAVYTHRSYTSSQRIIVGRQNPSTTAEAPNFATNVLEFTANNLGANIANPAANLLNLRSVISVWNATTNQIEMDIDGCPVTDPADEPVSNYIFASQKMLNDYNQAISLLWEHKTMTGNINYDPMQFVAGLYVNLRNGEYLLTDTFSGIGADVGQQVVSGVYDTTTDNFTPRPASGRVSADFASIANLNIRNLPTSATDMTPDPEKPSVFSNVRRDFTILSSQESGGAPTAQENANAVLVDARFTAVATDVDTIDTRTSNMEGTLNDVDTNVQTVDRNVLRNNTALSGINNNVNAINPHTTTEATATRTHVTALNVATS